jgi:hypothetical protein
MKAKYHMGIVLLALLVGCKQDPKAEQMYACDRMCRPQRVEKFEGGNCLCSWSDDGSPKTAAGEFCSDCARSCHPLHVKACKYSHETWGSGPDTCECGALPDAGAAQ